MVPAHQIKSSEFLACGTVMGAEEEVGGGEEEEEDGRDEKEMKR